MPARYSSYAEPISGISTALVGLGVVTVALAPFALPMVILLAVLLLPLLPLVILGAVAFAVFAAIRAIARGVRRRRRRPEPLSARGSRSRGGETLLRTPPRWSAE